ncbi:transporter [Cryobacterium frigoriphilum]|uniref:Transporter n=1 Tax=Cryobacterium frigoriphilum TaxID=1259150 RepID=A0A4R9A9D7_9MICO|nr:transporter [Cryobacterium frigoriphilum]TFD54566.1 transporter [Cryobacterium frigoriphilum]
MVRHLLALRFLVLKNTLRRSPWQLVGVIFGAVYGVGLLGGGLLGLIALSTQPAEVAGTIVTLGGSLLLLGWVLIPLLASGVDQTLDTLKLRTFPIRLNTLLLGLFVCGVLGVPGVVTLLLALATAATWWQHPLVALAAVICALVAVATCVVGSRMVVSLSSVFSSGRRFREVAGLIGLIPLVLAGPIIGYFTAGIGGGPMGDFTALANALGWTPFGVIWAVPAELAAGHYGLAAIRFVLGVGVLLVATLLWRRGLAVELVTPPHTANRTSAPGKLGFFARLPATPAGAVAARSLTYWTRDPRYLRQLVSLIVAPALMIFYSILFNSLGYLNAIGPIVALVLSLAIFSDVSYDSTAFASHLSSGLRGVDDRLGRVWAIAIFAVPVVLIVDVVSVAFSGAWALLPGILGLSIGLLLSGFGLSSVTSATVVVPVPAPGDSPFKAPPGAGFSNVASTFATWGILLLLVLPEIVLFTIGAATGQAVWGWLTVLVGVVLGTFYLWLGVRRGGARLDARGADLFENLVRHA